MDGMGYRSPWAANLSSRRADAMDGAAEITRDSDALGGWEGAESFGCLQNELIKKNKKLEGDRFMLPVQLLERCLFLYRVFCFAILRLCVKWAFQTRWWLFSNSYFFPNARKYGENSMVMGSKLTIRVASPGVREESHRVFFVKSLYLEYPINQCCGFIMNHNCLLFVFYNDLCKLRCEQIVWFSLRAVYNFSFTSQLILQNDPKTNWRLPHSTYFPGVFSRQLHPLVRKVVVQGSVWTTAFCVVECRIILTCQPLQIVEGNKASLEGN